MKILGFWKGFRNENFPSIYDENLEKRISEVDTKIVNYLKNGIWLLKLRTEFICPITGDTINDATVYTDGEWIWTAEYIFYLEKYDIQIPQEFMESLKKKKFIMLAEEDFDEEFLFDLEYLASDYTSQNSSNFH